MVHRNDDLLLRIAQADAYWAGFEYVEKTNAAHWARNTMTRFVRHPSHGCCETYTDDAQMSIGVAELLIEDPLLTERRCADKWVEVFRRDPRNGYARGFQSVLESVRDGAELLARVGAMNPQTQEPYRHSEKNGACMRVVPVGVLPMVDAVLVAAATQARVTHDTSIGVHSAQAIALLAHYAMYDEDGFEGFERFCWHFVRPSHRVLYEYLHPLLVCRWHGGPVHSPATSTVHAVFDLVLHAQSCNSVFRRVGDFGGDTDSVGAIAVGIASCRFRDPLPEFLERDLEPGGAYGVAFLQRLGKQLMDRYDR